MSLQDLQLTSVLILVLNIVPKVHNLQIIHLTVTGGTKILMIEQLKEMDVWHLDS